MRSFLHGIKRSVLEAWGLPCLPLALLFFGSRDDDAGSLPPERRGDEQDDAANAELQALNDGQSLLPMSGEDAQDHDLAEAVNFSLQHKDEEAQKEGREDQDDSAANNDLQRQPADTGGHDEDNTNQQSQDDEMESKLHHEHAAEHDLQEVVEIQISCTKNVPPEKDNLQAIKGMCKPSDGDKSLPLSLLRHNFYSCDDVVYNAWINRHPIDPCQQFCSRPRVKMKHEVLIFYLMTGMLDPGGRHPHRSKPPPHAMPMHHEEYGHDAWAPCPHHVPYSISLSIDMMVQSMTIRLTLEVATCLFHGPLFQAVTARDSKIQVFFPFTPLKWEKGNQVRERKDEVKTRAGSQTKTKRRMVEMRLFYLTKDVIDPG